MANGEIAHYKQFRHLPQCFQKSSAADVSEHVCKWEIFKIIKLNVRLSLSLFNPFPHTSILQQTTLTTFSLTYGKSLQKKF